MTRTGHNERNAKAEETGSSESRKLTESDAAYGQDPDHVPGNSYWGQFATNEFRAGAEGVPPEICVQSRIG